MSRTKRFLAVLLALLWPIAALAADVRHEIHFPDLPGYQTLACDLHMHTMFSDGQVWPSVRVDEAWRQGLDAIAITDHLEYQPHKNDVPTNHNRPYELAAGPARAMNPGRNSRRRPQTPCGDSPSCIPSHNAQCETDSPMLGGYRWCGRW